MRRAGGLVVHPFDSRPVAGVLGSVLKLSLDWFGDDGGIAMAPPAKRVDPADAELAVEVGMSRSHAHAILKAAEVKPHLLEQWVMSEISPEFDAQAAEVCGLYLDPPENTIVVSIDEKTGIQAKGLVRPDANAAPGKPARRDSEYERNGTQNLFAALQVHTGGVSAMPAKTRNRDDLLAFLDLVDQDIPEGRSVIAITDRHSGMSWSTRSRNASRSSRLRVLAGIADTPPVWTCSAANRFWVPLRSYSLSRRAGLPGAARQRVRAQRHPE